MDDTLQVLTVPAITVLTLLGAIPGLLLGRRAVRLKVSRSRLMLLSVAIASAIEAGFLVAGSSLADPEALEAFQSLALTAVTAVGPLALGIAISARSASWKVLVVALFACVSRYFVLMLLWISIAM